MLVAKEKVSKVHENIERVMKGKLAGIRKMLAVISSGGHVLLENFPVKGKTTFIKARELSLGDEFKRIQFTPDLLLMDVFGVSIFNQTEQPK